LDQAERGAFGVYLRALREAKGLTQRRAGEIAKVSCPYLAQLERGQRNPPSREVLARLASAYGVTEDKMLQEAGYREGGTSGVSPETIEWAFDCVRRDPEYSFGNRMGDYDLNLEAKAFIVEMYQQTTGRRLLLKTKDQDDEDTGP
jgi:transcriptional regulator with XRE-family HTH domain